MTTKTSQPRIDERSEQPYMGIRTQTPMKEMSKTIDKLFREMNAWASQYGVEPVKAPFLRYHVINMEGMMDIEVGFPVADERVVPPQQANGRVCAGVLPAGRYASLVYTGSGYTGNKTLIDWARANGLEWDRWDDPQGDAFRSRYESYLTDPKVEPKKTKWEIEVAIKIKGA